MAQVKEIKGEEFRRLQLTQLPMIKELDRVCRKHDIHYIIAFGTMLGAFRHKGYIPWDDDADIAMLREDYEKFRSVAHELDPSICFFQDHYNDPEYLWEYAKLRRTNTVFIRAGQEHMRGKTGVFIDIFPMDDVPDSMQGRILQDIDCYCLRKILWARAARVNSKGFWKVWFSILSLIPVNYVYKRVEQYASRSSNHSKKNVRILLFPAVGRIGRKDNPFPKQFGIPKKWFLSRAEYDFEGEKFFGPRDYNGYLTYTYGDYMKLPPEDKREPHAPVSEYKF